MKNAIVLTERDIDLLESRFKEVFVTKEELSDFKSGTFDKLDEILKEVKDSGEEREIVSDHLSTLGDKIENLEKIHPLNRHSTTV